MKWSHLTHVGKVRSVNEDYYCVRDDLKLFAVADGMGGHKAGEVASKEAIKYVEKAMESNVDVNGEELGEALFSGIIKANQVVYELSSKNSEYNGMGTTITAAVFSSEDLIIGHVGDSRCYLVRDSNIYRLTGDHSLVEDLVRQNQITPEQAEHHPHRNVLTRAVGTSPNLDVDLIRQKVKTGDVVVLCTDGLTKYVSSEDIVAVIKEKDLEQAANSLLEKALAFGGDDNITLVLVEID